MGIKMKAPKGGTGCSFRGTEYKADSKGVVDVPAEAAPELMAHGYMVLTQREDSAPTRDDLDAALGTLPGDQTDPGYVVSSMRRFFGKLFTDADEALVRSLVKTDAKA